MSLALAGTLLDSDLCLSCCHGNQGLSEFKKKITGGCAHYELNPWNIMCHAFLVCMNMLPDTTQD